jgi:predicted ATPase
MAVWEIQLLGGLRASRGSVVLARFPSRAVAALLARLALEPRRRHAREELIDLLWPDADLEVGRNRLRQALSTLRRLLEPPDLAPGSVLDADRLTVALSADAVRCDAVEFQRLLGEGAVADALLHYRGELLPGFIDEWVDEERLRLTALHERARARLAHSTDANLAAATPAHGHATLPAGADRNLPSYASVFFGREDDRRRVDDALRAHRLVTLAGLGGFGKTRLAVECARVAGGFDTVAFVPLAECTSAGLVGDRVRSALRMEAAPEDPLTQVCAFLGDRDVLLVLDNFEHLADEGARVVAELLERLPRLRLLVTSRRVLDVADEHVVRLDPLPVPDAWMEAASVAANPSVALFVDRARGARADFGLTEQNRAAVVRLCQALEGLPLAIEIAASRVRAYSPAEMGEALAARFDLLTRQGHRSSRHGRHASLHATIEWSWNLLTPQEQAFFSSLCVFRGDWTAAAVEAVCDTCDARGRLEALVVDSLLRADVADAGATRFSMLDTLREFAQERIGANGALLRARHRAYFLRIVQEALADDDALDEREFPNVKQALRTAVDDDEPAYALELAAAMRPYWEAHGTLPDELRLLEHAAARCARDHPVLHRALELLAQLSLVAGDVDAARRHAEHALQEAGAVGERRASALVTLARVEWERNQRAELVDGRLDEALALARAAGATQIEADALRVKATVALRHGVEEADYAAALALFERAETLYRSGGQARWAFRVLLSRSGCLRGLGRSEEARRMLARCEQFFTEHNSVADLIAVANMTGYLESGEGRWAEAVAAGRRSVQLAWARHAHLPLALALWNLPQPLVTLGEVEAAARLMSFAASFWQRSIGPLSPSDAVTVEEVRAAVAGRLGAERVATLWAEGADLALPQAVRLAVGA